MQVHIRQLTGSEGYQKWLKMHLQATLWQSLEWRRFQESLGRQTKTYIAEQDGSIVASAMVIVDRTTGGLSTWEIPRGPLVSEKIQEKREQLTESLIETILTDAKGEGCLCLFFSPTEQLFPFHSSLSSSSNRHIHPDATRIIDLSQSDEKILGQMHPKGRYNLKIAQRDGVTVQLSTDADAFFVLAKKTGQRDNFTSHSKIHYQKFLQSLPGSFLLMAQDSQKTPIAGLMGVVWEKTGLYYYGASNHEFRALMAPYLLQWEAMKLCKAKGCTQYDLFGIAPPAARANHPWEGITSFKEKFGGSVVLYPPEQQIVFKPIVKRLLEVKRKIIG